VLLRSIETGLFYEDASKWTADQTAAFDFEKTHRAVALVFAAKLEGVEMLLISEDPDFDLILPITRETQPTPPTSAPEAISAGIVSAPNSEPQTKASATSL
jgi:hypothetical protein